MTAKGPKRDPRGGHRATKRGKRGSTGSPKGLKVAQGTSTGSTRGTKRDQRDARGPQKWSRGVPWTARETKRGPKRSKRRPRGSDRGGPRAEIEMSRDFHAFLMEGLHIFLKSAISHDVFSTFLGQLRTECYVLEVKLMGSARSVRLGLDRGWIRLAWRG